MTNDNRLLTFQDRDEWRSWLERHHDRADEAWVVIYKKGVKDDALSFKEAQDEALCFGWTDVKSKGVDKERYSLRFTPRRPGSMWSISNVRRVEQLIKAGRMAQAGLERITEARQNGQWEAAIRSAQTDVLPPDLHVALQEQRGALAGYKSMREATKRQLLHALYTAKSEATRRRRIAGIVQEALELAPDSSA